MRVSPVLSLKSRKPVPGGLCPYVGTRFGRPGDHLVREPNNPKLCPMRVEFFYPSGSFEICADHPAE